MKRKSKEELFLEKLYQLAELKGDPEQEVDRYEVGGILGANPRAIDNIVQVLTKNNFIKRGEETLVFLTPLGIRFVQDQP